MLSDEAKKLYNDTTHGVHHDHIQTNKLLAEVIVQLKKLNERVETLVTSFKTEQIKPS